MPILTYSEVKNAYWQLSFMIIDHFTTGHSFIVVIDNKIVLYFLLVSKHAAMKTKLIAGNICYNEHNKHHIHSNNVID